MRAIFLATTALVLTGLLLAPAAVAQPMPKIRVNVKWEVDHEMMLPENGKGDMGTIVEVIGEDFVCAGSGDQALRFKVDVQLVDSFAKWAGASMVPGLVPVAKTQYFVFDGGKPGFKQTAPTGAPATNSGNTEAKLNIAWDVEGRPATNAVQEYRVRGIHKLEGSTSSCVPTSFNWLEEPGPPMVVKMFDKPSAENATTDATICEENPARCVSTATAPNEGGNAPGPDLLIVLLGLVGLLGIWRRRN